MLDEAGRGRRRPAPSPWWSRGWPKAWRARSPRQVAVPTIGIGASAGCDGQILVTDDMLGLFDWTPRSCGVTPTSKALVAGAAAGYAADVRSRQFPATAETYFARKP